MTAYGFILGLLLWDSRLFGPLSAHVGKSSPGFWCGLWRVADLPRGLARYKSEDYPFSLGFILWLLASARDGIGR